MYIGAESDTKIYPLLLLDYFVSKTILLALFLSFECGVELLNKACFSVFLLFFASLHMLIFVPCDFTFLYQ